MQLTIQQNYYATQIKFDKVKCNNKNNNIIELSFKGVEDSFDYTSELNKKLKTMNWIKRKLLGGQKKAELQTTIELIDFRNKKCNVTEASLNTKEEELSAKEETLRVKKAEAAQIKTEGLQMKEEAIQQKEDAIRIKMDALNAQEKTLEIEEKSILGSIDSSQIRTEIIKALKEKEAFLDEQMIEIGKKDTLIENLKKQISDLKSQLTKKQEAYNTVLQNLEIAKKKIAEISSEVPKIIINMGKKIK